MPEADEPDLDLQFVRHAVEQGFLEAHDGGRYYRQAQRGQQGAIGRMLVRAHKLSSDQVLDLYLQLGRIPCPRCATQVIVPDAGRILRCGGCRKKFRLPESSPYSAPKQLGRYRIVEKIGQGGMGDLYKAVHPELDKTYAVKVIAPECTRNKTYLERFKREARVAAKVDHPNTVGIVNFGVEDGLHYLVMPFVDGENLQTFIESRGPLPPEKALIVMAQIAKGLKSIHDAGIMHRDIKPDNILVDRSGRIMLGDFGLAREADGAHLTQTGVILGTPQYMSPEQCDGVDVDVRSDLYNLGITLYFLLHGKAPFVDESPMAVMLKHKTEPLPVSREVRQQCSKQLLHVLDKLSAKEPDQRYQTVDDVLRDLKKIHEGLTVTRRLGKPRALGKRPGRGRRWAVAGTLLVLLAAGAALAVQRWGLPRWPQRRGAAATPTGPGAEASVATAELARIIDRAFGANGQAVEGLERGVRVVVERWDLATVDRLFVWRRGKADLTPATARTGLVLTSRAAADEVSFVTRASFKGQVKVRAVLRYTPAGEGGRLGLRLFQRRVHGVDRRVFLGVESVGRQFYLAFHDDLLAHQGVTVRKQSIPVVPEDGRTFRLLATVRDGHYQVEQGSGTFVDRGPLDVVGPCGIEIGGFSRLELVRFEVEGQLDPAWIAAQK